MPELPEVHTVLEDLRRAGLPGRRIGDALVEWPRTVGGDAEAFRTEVRGDRIDDLRRRGKYLVFTLESGRSLLTHLRMSGRLYLQPASEPRTGYERVRLTLVDPAGYELRFHDPRKFGRMLLVDDPSPILERLGAEPLSPTFGTEVLTAELQRRRRQIKPLLLDQTVVAGLGNIYVDEALWEARIHPERPANSLTDAETADLAVAIPTVLRRGIENLGTSLGTGTSNFVFPESGPRARNQEELRVFRRTGAPCPRCGTPIRRIIVGQRSSHVCPACQTPPR